MKIIKYKFLSCEINHGTEENPNIEQILLDKAMYCKTQAEFDDNYPIAEKEAAEGTIEVSGEFEPVSDELTDAERIAQLEEALELLLSGVTE